ncbi:MAG: hypothetical protein ABIH88_00645, partial [Patescibacteria group bacterium]|nr:hypothetical protein [Patescibacteria group bacterium]
GEFIMLLNSDTVLEKGSLKTLLDFAVLKENSAFSSLLFLQDKKPQIDYYMKFPNLWQVFLYHNPVIRPIALKIPFLRNLICFLPKKEIFEVDQLPGAALLASRKVWNRVGLLDEDYSFLYEDVDWCYRAKKKKVDLFVVPDSKVLHIGGASWKKKLKEETFGFYKQYFSSMLLFVRKNYSKISLVEFRICLFFNFLILGVFYFLFSFLSFKFFKKAKEKARLAFYCLIYKTTSSRVFL